MSKNTTFYFKQFLHLKQGKLLVDEFYELYYLCHERRVRHMIYLIILEVYGQRYRQYIFCQSIKEAYNEALFVKDILGRFRRKKKNLVFKPRHLKDNDLYFIFFFFSNLKVIMKIKKCRVSCL